jgi:hypothetical protein
MQSLYVDVTRMLNSNDFSTLRGQERVIQPKSESTIRGTIWTITIVVFLVL